MKSKKPNDQDADDTVEYHGKRIAHYEGLAAKNRAMADHHRMLHSKKLSTKDGLHEAASRIASSGY